MNPKILVTKVDGSVTFPLRRAVLGAHILPPLPQPDPDTQHFAVFDGDKVIASGTARRRAAPWAPGSPGFQLRGMAVVPDRRGAGIGSAVLAAIIEYVSEQGGGQLWCQARPIARGLYERAGFQQYGDPFDEGGSGPRVYMYRQVERLLA